jgi:diguanylate cyclase (GGDEF)-like protein
MLDVDHLKALNDRAGHSAGDAILSLVGRAATDVVRAYDLVARFGGDEFVVLIHDSTEESAHRTAERIQQRFRRSLAERPELGGTTISVGTATWEPGRTTSDLLSQADQEMYVAKRTQR